MAEINTEYQCRWNPIDPNLCFEANDCGCFVDPCEFFNLTPDECGKNEADEEDWLYVEVCPLESS